MNEAEFKKLVKPDSYQVFLFSCPATLPYAFARHPWFVVNRKGVISRWEIFWRPEIDWFLRWGHLHKDFYPPFQGTDIFPFSRTYVWPHVHLHGIAQETCAEKMVEVIEQSAELYPYCREYSLSGPNSNTYVQWVLDRFPDAGLALPWNSIGKRYKIARTS